MPRTEVEGSGRRHDRSQNINTLEGLALKPFRAKLPPVRIGREACGGAHYWARRFRVYGHAVTLMAPQFVRRLLDSRVVDMPMAFAPTFVLLSSLKPLFFNSFKNEWCFSDNARA